LIRLGRIGFHVRQTYGFLIILGAWWGFAEWLGPARLPSPDAVAVRLIDVFFESPEIAAQGGGSEGITPHITASIIRVCIGGVIGISMGIAVGLLMGWIRQFRDFIQPPIEVLRAIPPLAIAPMLLIWFGPTATTQYVMLIGYMFLAIVINTLEAIRNVPPIYQDYARCMGATRRQIYRTVIVPAILPSLNGGIRVILGLSFAIVLAGELLATDSGLGWLMILSERFFMIGRIVVIVVIFVILSLILNGLYLAASRYVNRWVP
jgi:ABC-type nitrate/sulfonate/bicarbonate transport system permease component